MEHSSFESLLDEAPVLSQPTVRGDYFLPESHMRMLEKIEHLSRYSQFVQIVVGLPGSGKSTLLRQLTPDDADPDLQACLLRGGDVEGVEQLLQQLAMQLQLELPARASAAQTLAAITAHAAVLQQASRLFLIIVDDAEALESDALALLFQLQESIASPDAQPHLVLFGTPLLKEQLAAQRFQAVMASSAHVMELEPLSFEELQGFIAHRFGEAASALSERQLKKLYNDCLGLPGQIPKALDRILDSEESIAQPKQSSHLPAWLWGVGAVVVLITVAGVWVMMRGEDSSRLRIALPAPAAAPPKVAVAEVAKIEEETLEQRLEKVKAALEKERLGQAPALVPMPVPVEPQAVAVAVAVEAPPAATSSAVAHPIDPVEVPTPQESVDSAQLPIAPVRSEAALAVTEPGKRVLTLPEDVTAVEAEAAGSVAVKTAAAAPGAAVESDDEAVLLGWDVRGYTLQMLGARNEASVKGFIREQATPEKFFRFDTLYKGKPWYVVVYGNYPDRATAVAAVADLPLELRKIRPWARSVRGVQDDIRRQK